MAAPIDFYFDFSSPFGYLASERIDEIGKRHGRAVTWRPFLLGATFKIVGTAPLLDYPMKGEYSKHDMMRSARLLGVLFRLPSVFPTSSLSACRIFYWLADTRPDLAKPFASAIYRRYFADDKPIEPAEQAIEIAASLGLDRAAVSAALQDPAVKARLKSEVDQGIARGVFGSPFVFIDGEPFWGSDRLDQIERWLETGGW
ncbi:MAG: 2-hydroxychromene-2-carboxylate isomerase [Alphaproteobacteria bacterium]|nr:2-hydroxychromene-2-carboxylate isomerase [Alphaproteobacteria bacterium]